MGGKSSTISTSEPRIGALRIQQSTYGLPLFVVWGANRVPGNLIDYNNFRTIAVTTTTTSGGKGGGGKVKQSETKYEYYASPIMALGEGPVASIQTVWRGKTKIVGGALTGSKTTTEVAVIPSNGIVRPAFYGYWTAGVSVARCAGGADATDAALTSGTDYTVAAGVYTFGAAHVGRTVRIVYTWTPPAWMTAADVAAGFTLFRGDVGQAPWSYMSTSYPAKALAYSHTAYVAAQSYRLTDSAEVENHTFEVNGRLQYPGMRDANPADIAADALTNPQFGANFPGARLGDLTTYSTFCRASGIFLSPALTEQTQAGEFLEQLAKMTNSALVWSEGKLKIIPYGDAPLSANGAVYSPNLTPVYDLTDDDFQREGGDDPVKCNRKTTADAFNQVQVEFLNRANDYNVEIAEAKDQANIEQFGLRTAEPVEMHWITDAQVATYVSNLILQRGLYVRNEYTFRLGWKYALLEPMDLVTLTDAKLDVAKIPVRIISIDENEWGDLTVIAEDFPAGVASAALYPPTSTDGFFPDFAADPGAITTPAFFEPPASLTGGGLQVWCAVSGSGANWGGCSVWCSTDGTNYKRVGAIYGGSRYGTLSASLAAAPGGAATVLLDGKGGQILSGSDEDARSLATLCWIGGELVAHTTATLIAPNSYVLTLGVRGAYQTPDGAKAGGTRFIRLDAALGKSESLPLSMLGRPLYFKFTSFNVYSAGEQSLDEVTAYPHIVGDNLGSAAYTLQDGLTGALPSVGVGVNFVPNPDFEFNAANAPTVATGEGVPALVGMALADGWQVGVADAGVGGTPLFSAALTMQTGFASKGRNALLLAPAAGAVVPNDNIEKRVEAVSIPVYVVADQKFSLRADARTYNTATPTGGVTVGQRIAVAYYNSAGAEISRSVVGCPTPNATFTEALLNAQTVPANAVHLRVICQTWIRNNGGAAYTIPAALLTCLFDNFYASGISASDVVLSNGTSVEAAVAEALADAAAAQAAADAAAADAAAASAALDGVVSDDVLSRVEKTGEVIRWTSAQNELTDVRAKADAFGISRAAYDAAYNTLNAYIAGLSPAFGDMTQDTPITGTTYRANWAGYLDQRTLLLNAIATKAKQLADTAQAAANAAATAAATAQTTADNAQATANSAVMSAAAAAAAAAAAQASANVANAALTEIGSDAILSAIEKPQVILQYQTIINEKAGIEAQADAYGVTTEKAAYQAAVAALTTYLGTLNAPTNWDDTSGYTNLTAP